jgi:ParB-like chromosome segregation protein Spo0J
MYTRLLMATVAVILFLLGPPYGTNQWDGSIFRGVFDMDEKQVQAVPSIAPTTPQADTRAAIPKTGEMKPPMDSVIQPPEAGAVGAPSLVGDKPRATTRPVKVRLSQLVLLPELYSHRDKSELDIDNPVKIRPLADNIAERGLEVPIEIFVDKDGRVIVIKGNRRVMAHRLNVKEGKAGFTHDMELEAIEILGADDKELAIRSINENVHRLTYTDPDRVRAAMILKQLNVDDSQAAMALGVSAKTYARLLLIGEHPWMLNLVERNCVPISYAPNLLQAAKNQGRMTEVEADVMEWVALKEKAITDLMKTQKLSVAKQLVKTYLNKALADHWVAQILKKERLNEIVPMANQEVVIDPKQRKVSVKVEDVDVMEMPLTELARLLGDLEAAKQYVERAVKIRHSLESSGAVRGPQDVGQAALAAEGLAYLRQQGLGDLADQVEMGLIEGPEATEVIDGGQDD